MTTRFDRLESLVTKFTPVYPEIKISDLFGNAPEGDFQWIQDEGDDWTPVLDDDHWEKYSRGTDMGRKNGKLWVEAWSIDQDGNREADEYWCEQYGPEAFEPLRYHIGIANVQEHYKALATYHLWCAERLADPLGMIDEDLDGYILSTWQGICMDKADYYINQAIKVKNTVLWRENRGGKIVARQGTVI